MANQSLERGPLIRSVISHGQIVTAPNRLVHGQLASVAAENRAPAAATVRLPPGWAAGSGPIYRRLADALATGLAMGTIGERLPSERELAATVGVSRTTAVAAYELLVDRGALERRTGSGTFVRRRPRSGSVCEDPIQCVLSFFAEGS